MRAYSADLYRYAWWLCRDRHFAEDVVQETFARAWRSWAELRELGQAKAWLVTIMRNEYARAVSRRKNEMNLDDLDDAQLPAIPSLEAGLETAQLVARLPATYREPLLLQVLGGFSCAEIASIVGTSEGAIMTRLTRARQALRQQFIEPAERKAVK